ncbi:MAG: hypothetical protein ACOYYI_08240 [Chloroflexota bacterium]
MFSVIVQLLGCTTHASKLGAYIFFCRCDKEGLGNYEKWMMYEKAALVQALATPYMRFDSTSGIVAGQRILSRSLVDGYLGMVKPLIDANLDLGLFSNNPAKFPVVAQQVFRNAGLTGHEIPKPDAIGNLISKRYSVRKWNKWPTLLKGEYKHGHMLLKIADTYFDTHFTTWLAHQDTFNEVLFRAFQEFLASKRAPGTIGIVDKNGVPIKYGRLLNDPAFKTAYPDLQDDLSKIHRRRNHLPSSHAYDEKTGDKSRPLKKSERNDYKKYLDDAFNQIIEITERLGI